MLRAATLLLFLTTVPAAAQPSLGLPVDCRLGEQCFIQQYVDLDPGPEAQDYACGGAVYDGHKGVDIRLPSLAEAGGDGVAVIAAAPGRVKAVRDGAPDVIRRSAEELRQVEGVECGNGVVLEHADGWETQYCHLRQGSVGVRRGAVVAKGDRLGLIGSSGASQMAHAHLSVRHDGAVIDPFLGAAVGEPCIGPDASPNSLWDAETRPKLGYSDGEIIEVGFADGQLSVQQVELGAVRPPTEISKALVFYARAINLQQGDLLRLELSGPDGFGARRDFEPMTRHRAHQMNFVGKALRAERWPAGSYEGVVTVMRGGEPHRTARIAMSFR